MKADRGWRDDLKHAAITFVLFTHLPVLAMCVMLANQSGWFAFSEGNANPHPNREFTLTVEDTGRTVFTATENVSEALREEIMGTTKAQRRPYTPSWSRCRATRPKRTASSNAPPATA